jgi:CheY-like chemotaxis protein
MRLYWPAEVLGAKVDEEAVGTPPPLQTTLDRPRTVWLVEDEAVVRELVRRTLGDEGLEVIIVGDGSDALRFLEREPQRPDIVITDLFMPVVNGRQVSDAVLARYPEVPVLFMSGYAADDMVSRGLMPSTAAFLQKPFTPEQLVQALETMLMHST